MKHFCINFKNNVKNVDIYENILSNYPFQIIFHGYLVYFKHMYYLSIAVTDHTDMFSSKPMLD
jgi:vacuolar-type H+-ATPase subunit I/STV1